MPSWLAHVVIAESSGLVSTPPQSTIRALSRRAPPSCNAAASEPSTTTPGPFSAASSARDVVPSASEASDVGHRSSTVDSAPRRHARQRLWSALPPSSAPPPTPRLRPRAGRGPSASAGVAPAPGYR
jgi:hypothetical protein